VHDDRPAIGTFAAGENAKQGRLARTVLADKTESLTIPGDDVDTGQDGPAVVSVRN
jgi:hypothetical protein